MVDVPITSLPTPFLGTHTPRLDDKGRLILPAKFREPLAEGPVSYTHLTLPTNREG